MLEYDAAFDGVAAQAELVRRGEPSARELLELALGRIERLDGKLNAFGAVFADRALADADREPLLGCRWRSRTRSTSRARSPAVDRAAQPHELATTGGRVSTTGVAGLTRGGGGNLGVVTAFEFRLRPVGPQVFAGLALYPAARGRELMALYRDVVRDAPEGLSLAFLYLHAAAEEGIPQHLHGERAVAVAIAGMYAGPVDEGRAVMRAFPPATADFFEPLPYADFQCMIDDPPGYRNWWTSEHLADLPDEAIEAIARRSEAMPAGLSQLFMVSWGGAVARVGHDASPLCASQARFVVHPFGMGEDPADDAATIAWARGFPRRPRRVRHRCRLPQLRRRRGRGACARGLRPRQLRAARAGQGRVGPREPLPGERQRPAGRGRDGGVTRDRSLRSRRQRTMKDCLRSAFELLPA